MSKKVKGLLVRKGAAKKAIAAQVGGNIRQADR